MTINSPLSCLIIFFLILNSRILYFGKFRNEVISFATILTSIYIVILCNFSNYDYHCAFELIIESAYNGFVIACISITLAKLNIETRIIRDVVYSKKHKR